MSNAREHYEILEDAFEYSMDNWLRLDLADGSKNEAKTISIAAAFLIDNLFAKENAGSELTALAREELGSKFNPKDLTEEATKIRLGMSGDEFASGKSPLREYLYWIAQDKEEVLEAFKDNAGRLALVYADELATLVCVEHPEVEKIRISEIVFLNAVHALTLIYKQVMKQDFYSLASIAFFQDIEDEFELIRARIDD
ncbi:MAG: hypothetical protein K6B65_06500 [Bacilli bacterium]|nr:hypothetical protein [Bacilli bacterium]